MNQYVHIQNFENSKAALANAKSALDRANVNLKYATITSPIDGVVLNRAIEEGQTVAASFSTPTLFTIVNDLTQMEVQTSVDEADIGKIINGQRVEFTVDAYSDLKFEGTVSQVRLQPVTTNNVVTYTVVIGAPNPDKILKPGMTANATFFVTERKDILLVSAKATRFTPDPETMMAYMPPMGQNGAPAAGFSAPPMPSMGEGAMSMEGAKNDSIHTVWIKGTNGALHPQKITVGVTDEINFEVINGVNEGDELVTSMTIAGAHTIDGKKPAGFFRPPGSEKRTPTTNTQRSGPPQ